jgi:putative tryptophan/tyrosine transport system substrate-binding protein
MPIGQLQRREFITLIGGAAAAWPLAARGQQAERTRRIGVLLNVAENDSQAPLRVAALLRGLQEVGWTVGRNLQIDYRWAAGDAELFRRYAADLVALTPDLILAAGSPAVAALQLATSTVPIVFVSVIDPIGGGFVASLAQPGANITGFEMFEYGIGGKWLDLLKQISPRTTQVAVIRDLAISAGSGQLGAIQAVAPLLSLEVRPIDARDESEIERGITAFARSSNGALIVTAATLTTVHRGLIIALAARYKLPALYPIRFFVSEGGLISYGPDLVDPYRQAAAYVDRILKGEKPADLPVQAPTKYELVINMKTAKALGIDVPAQLLARADAVIE